MALGITNQRETLVCWDRSTGKPLCNAIVWQDTRSADICRELAGAAGPGTALSVKNCDEGVAKHPVRTGARAAGISDDDCGRSLRSA